MMQRLIILFTAILFASSTWATAVVVEWTDMGKTAFACAEVYGYTIARGEEGELKEGMMVKFEYWRKNLQGCLPSLNADDIIGRSSLMQSLDAKLISKDEVVEIMANCEKIRKEIEVLAVKLNKCCLTVTR